MNPLQTNSDKCCPGPLQAAFARFRGGKHDGSRGTGPGRDRHWPFLLRSACAFARRAAWLLIALSLSGYLVGLVHAGTASSGSANPAVRVLGPSEAAVLRDPGGLVRAAQLSDPALQARFVPWSQGSVPNYTRDVVWIRLELAPAERGRGLFRLELTSTLLNDVRLYSPTADGDFGLVQAGDRFAFAERPVPSRRPVFDLESPAERPKTYYLRIHSDSTLAGQLLLWDPRAFEASQQLDSLWIGGLMGIILISLLFFLQAWVLNRDRMLLSAAGVTLAFAVAATAHLGLLSQYVLPERPGLADAVHPISLALFFPSLCLLFDRALGLGPLFPRVSKAQVMVSVLCIGAAISRIFDLYVDIGWVMMMGGMLFALGWITAGGWLVWHARRTGLATAMAMSVFTASFAVAPLIALNIVPGSRYIEAFWVFGCVGFILLAQFSTLEEVRKARLSRRLAEQAAQRASQRADQELNWRRQQSLYFAGVAHDLRTPLSAVRIGLANLGRESMTGQPGAQQRIDRIQLAASRASDMIERHLQMQRLEQPDMLVHCAPADVDDCLAQIEAAIIEAWPNREFRIKVLSGVPAALLMDSELVIRAVLNLLSNAAVASPPDATIHLTLRRDTRDSIGFEVADSGPGLGELDFHDLLEVHWRRNAPVQRTGTSEVERFGIGLPMVARIAALHGGRILYRRESGATIFTLWLPCVGTEPRLAGRFQAG